MPKMNLTHFEAAILFALFTSVVLGVVTKKTDRDRLLAALDLAAATTLAALERPFFASTHCAFDVLRCAARIFACHA